MSDRDLERVGRMAELGLMTGVLAHELRQPVFALKALLQLIEAGAVRPEDKLPELLRQVGYMERLVTGVGAYATEPGQGQGPVDARAVLVNAVELLRHRADRRHVQLVSDLPAVKAVACDPTALMQMAVNIIHNAIDASPPGGRVVVLFPDDATTFAFDVMDDGPGIPEDLRERVFEPLFTTKPAGQGTGLGLAITRQAARAAGGEVELIQSARGARVRVRLGWWVG